MTYHDKIEISHKTKEYIVDNLVEPYYTQMIKTTISGKKSWRTLGITLETCSKMLVAIGGILSFSAGVYHDNTLSFVSGSVSCISLALLQIASFSYAENKKQGDELNILLKKLDLDTVPLMARSENATAVTQIQMQSQRPPEFQPSGHPQLDEFGLLPRFSPSTHLERNGALSNLDKIVLRRMGVTRVNGVDMGELEIPFEKLMSNKIHLLEEKLKEMEQIREEGNEKEKNDEV